MQVRQLGMQLVKGVYELTATFPDSEKYGLCSQMQRAAVSVPSNISEGSARYGKRELIHFLTIARGSLCELETHVMIGHELGFIENHQPVMSLINELFAKLNGLIRSTQQKVNAS